MFRVSEPVSQEDYQKIYDLRYQVLRSPWKQPRGSERDDAEDISVHAMICDADGRCIATGRLQFNSENECQIRFMAVCNEFRGQGFGNMILEFLEEKARKKSATTIVLQARENAVRFYESAGYLLEEKTFLLFDAIQHYRMRKQL